MGDGLSNGSNIRRTIMRYIIQYSLHYEHRVMVGIEAESR